VDTLVSMQVSANVQIRVNYTGTVRNCMAPHGLLQTVAAKVCSSPHYSRHVQFLQFVELQCEHICFIQMHFIEYTPLSDYYIGIFQETGPRKTDENTVNHRVGGVGLVIANHHGGGGNSV